MRKHNLQKPNLHLPLHISTTCIRVTTAHASAPRPLQLSITSHCTRISTTRAPAIHSCTRTPPALAPEPHLAPHRSATCLCISATPASASEPRPPLTTPAPTTRSCTRASPAPAPEPHLLPNLSITSPCIRPHNSKTRVDKHTAANAIDKHTAETKLSSTLPQRELHCTYAWATPAPGIELHLRMSRSLGTTPVENLLGNTLVLAPSHCRTNNDQTHCQKQIACKPC